MRSRKYTRTVLIADNVTAQWKLELIHEALINTCVVALCTEKINGRRTMKEFMELFDCVLVRIAAKADGSTAVDSDLLFFRMLSHLRSCRPSVYVSCWCIWSLPSIVVHHHEVEKRHCQARAASICFYGEGNSNWLNRLTKENRVFFLDHLSCVLSTGARESKISLSIRLRLWLLYDLRRKLFCWMNFCW